MDVKRKVETISSVSYITGVLATTALGLDIAYVAEPWTRAAIAVIIAMIVMGIRHLIVNRWIKEVGDEVQVSHHQS